VQDAAGQLRKSPHQFSGIGASSPLLWLARGYAVLDGPTMPIVAQGEGDDVEPNDTYVQQLVESARAAVQACPLSFFIAACPYLAPMRCSLRMPDSCFKAQA
jgi:hypothetical protein